MERSDGSPGHCKTGNVHVSQPHAMRAVDTVVVFHSKYTATCCYNACLLVWGLGLVIEGDGGGEARALGLVPGAIGSTTGDSRVTNITTHNVCVAIDISNHVDHGSGAGELSINGGICIRMKYETNQPNQNSPRIQYCY